MPIVVSDASPLHYLILIGAADILPALYGRVIVPRAVAVELQHPHAPLAVREWLSSAPPWVEIASATAPQIPETTFGFLGPGEREAIAVAVERRADIVLMDDREAVEEARRHGLAVVGTLGVLDLAGRRGLTNLRESIGRLQATNFRASPLLLRRLLDSQD